MTYLDAIILGFVQGITEFIPVSSSGHLILADQFFTTQSTFGFDVLLNIGTLAALVIYFRKRIYLIFLSIIRHKNWVLARNIVISTIPAAVLGYFLADRLEEGIFRNAAIVAVMLFVVGLVMVIEPRLKHAKGTSLDNLSKPRAVIIGFAQALALIPGTSRSGMTILAGRFSGLSHEKAAEYSFLIAIPILSGALLKTMLETGTRELTNSSTGVVVVGIATAFATGYFAITLMLKFLQNHNLAAFGYYRIALALLILLTLV